MLAEPLPDLVVVLVLEAWKSIGDRAHVAAALDIILASQRIESRSVLANVSREQREIDHREHIVRRVVMVRNAERPTDPRSISLRVRKRRLFYVLRWDASNAFAPLQRGRLHRRRVILIAGGAKPNELVILQTGVDNDSRHRLGERDISADVQAEPNVGPLGSRRAPRIHGEGASAVVDALQDVMKEDRVIFAGVRAPQEDHVGLFRLTIRAGPAARSERYRQTGDARSVSRSVAAVDIVGPEHDAGELLRQEVQLVARLRAREDAERITAVRVPNPSEPRDGPIQGLVPGCGPERVTVPDHRLRQSYIWRHLVSQVQPKPNIEAWRLCAFRANQRLL